MNRRILQCVVAMISIFGVGCGIHQPPSPQKHIVKTGTANNSPPIMPGATVFTVKHPVPGYTTGSCWVATPQYMCAGYADSNPSQGIVIAYNLKTSQTIGIFATKKEDGPLQLVSFAGNQAVLMAKDGASYVFYVKSDQLVRQ